MAGSLNILNVHCREASRLISDAQDRTLSPLESTGLSIHLVLCAPCRRYRNQLALLRRLMHATAISKDADDAAQLSTDAKARIHRHLYGV
jgi:hypothetical protein